MRKHCTWLNMPADRASTNGKLNSRKKTLQRIRYYTVQKIDSCLWTIPGCFDRHAGAWYNAWKLGWVCAADNDKIRDTILTCARKRTWVSLIYAIVLPRSHRNEKRRPSPPQGMQLSHVHVAWTRTPVFRTKRHSLLQSNQYEVGRNADALQYARQRSRSRSHIRCDARCSAAPVNTHEAIHQRRAATRSVCVNGI